MKGDEMSKLSIEEIEDSDARAEIWREEERESSQYMFLIELAKNAFNRKINTLGE